MRSVVEAGIVEPGKATGIDGIDRWLQALARIRLVPAKKSLHHIVSGSENIAHIVKHGEAKPLSQVRQADRGKSQFEIVHKQRRTANRKTRLRIPGTCLI